MTSVQALRTQQYCLKWNNHNKNVSNVFDRLRTCEQFVDVTLFTSDRKSIKCHKILLSAGSGYLEERKIWPMELGYLEEILEDNPSDHPTIVLSQILFEDLKLLIDFMYAGEVSVEQSRLVGLLDAAKILKIKGLYETAPFEDENMEASSENNTSGTTESLPSTKPSSNNNAIVVETQKRKRSTSSTDSVTHLPPSPKSPKPATAVNPLYGVTNAYFVTDANMGTLRPKPNIPPGTLPMLINKNDLGHEDSSPPPPPPAAAQPATTKVNEESIKLQKMNQIIATGQIRRYKQYTEETLQQALKEIMDGQSINRSSVKYNIPARTLRDWMKRLNIKSVFTHNNNQTPGGNNNNNNITSDSKEDEEVKSDGPDDGTEHEDEDDDDSAPRLCSPQLKIISEDMKKEIPEDEEMEEEIDDDEEEKLKIDEEM